ncbi:MAG: hypothetical protein GF315_05460 [candidate division Zixibacteria bacterium]|nr:hypothetical protein [candidate division Zixibacteria bacterium]
MGSKHAYLFAFGCDLSMPPFAGGCGDPTAGTMIPEGQAFGYGFSRRDKNVR